MFRFFLYIGLLAVLLNCNNADVYSQKGLVFLSKQKNLSALTFFNKALDVDAGNGLGLFGKGQILLSNKHTVDIGYRMLNQAIKELDDKNHLQYITQAKLLLVQHEISHRHFDKAQSLLDDVKKNSQYDQQVFILEYLMLLKRRQNYKALGYLKENCKGKEISLTLLDICARSLFTKFNQVELAKSLLIRDFELTKVERSKKDAKVKVYFKVVAKKIKLHSEQFELLLELLNRTRDDKNLQKILEIMRIKFSNLYSGEKWQELIQKAKKKEFVIRDSNFYKHNLLFNYRIFYYK